ncbi:DUF2975 domain-containing protein [Algibacter sp. TI.3.09]|uniref:DUF2975 domain-containing protein n=1 Tax=Algibacter sp. TI.3.09 TaxID=3121298 RepID=UPI00311F1615
MTKNRLLNISIVLCKFIKLGYIVFFIGLTFVFVHVQMDRDYYKDKEVTINSDSKDFFISSRSILKSEITNTNIYTLDNIKTFSLYLGYFQLSGILLVLFLSIKEFQKILKSVKKVKSFEEDNIKSFRRIGKFIFIYTLLTSFQVMNFNKGYFHGFGISLTPLFLILFAFIMGEIFKEGYALKQENDLTI